MKLNLFDFVKKNKSRMSLQRVTAALRPRLVASLAAVAPSRRYAAVKSSTDAAGSIMGLGKGKKKAGKFGAVEKRVLPVETDAERLVHYVCGSNIYVTGEDVKVGASEEYPAWLWQLRLTAPPPLEELSPDSKEYWQRVRTAAMRRNNKLKSLKKF